MQALELPLYPTLESKPKPPPISNPRQSLENAINALFPEQSEESKILRMRRLLGDKALMLSDESIECIATEFQFLIDTWLSEFEKDIFNGKTLHEVLKAKAYGSNK